MNEYEHHYLGTQDNGLTQELVARCIREGDQLYLVEIWVKIHDGNSQSKIKVNLPSLANKIATEESILLEGVLLDNAFMEFDEVIEPEVKAEHQLESLVNKIHQQFTEKQTNELISAAEAALSAHPTNQSIEEIVEQITKSPKS